MQFQIITGLAFVVAIAGCSHNAVDSGQSSSPAKDQSVTLSGEHNSSTTGEVAALQGTWQQISARPFGGELPKDVVSEMQIVVKGNFKTALCGGQVIASDVQIDIDPAADPNIWDEQVILESGERIVVRGIYKLEGDVLTRAFAVVDEERPIDFVSTKGSRNTIAVFQRVKDDK